MTAHSELPKGWHVGLSYRDQCRYRDDPSLWHAENRQGAFDLQDEGALPPPCVLHEGCDADQLPRKPRARSWPGNVWAKFAEHDWALRSTRVTEWQEYRQKREQGHVRVQGRSYGFAAHWRRDPMVRVGATWAHAFDEMVMDFAVFVPALPAMPVRIKNATELLAVAADPVVPPPPLPPSFEEAEANLVNGLGLTGSAVVKSSGQYVMPDGRLMSGHQFAAHLDQWHGGWRPSDGLEETARLCHDQWHTEPGVYAGAGPHAHTRAEVPSVVENVDEAPGVTG